MLYTIYADKPTMFSCTIQLEGASLSDAHARIILERKGGIRFLYEGTVDSNGMCVVELPAARSGFAANETGNMKLEVIAGDVYFQPWSSEFEVVSSKRIQVEVAMPTQEIKKPIIKIEEINTPMLSATNTIVNKLRERGITKHNIKNNKSAVLSLLRESISAFSDADVSALIKNIIHII